VSMYVLGSCRALFGFRLVSGGLQSFEVDTTYFNLLERVKNIRILWNGRGYGVRYGCFYFNLFIRLLKHCGNFFRYG
jgi:hypothetical protein